MDAAVVFLAFTATWCGPCQQLHRDFDGHRAVTFVDVDAEPEMARRHSVRRMPTIVAVADGREVARKVGYSGKKDLEKWMENAQEQNVPDLFPYWDNESEGQYSADWEDGYPYDTGTKVQE